MYLIVLGWVLNSSAWDKDLHTNDILRKGSSRNLQGVEQANPGMGK